MKCLAQVHTISRQSLWDLTTSQTGLVSRPNLLLLRALLPLPLLSLRKEITLREAS